MYYINYRSSTQLTKNDNFKLFNMHQKILETLYILFNMMMGNFLILLMNHRQNILFHFNQLNYFSKGRFVCIDGHDFQKLR